MNGVYAMEGTSLHINFSIKLIGESHDNTIIKGGFLVYSGKMMMRMNMK